MSRSGSGKVALSPTTTAFSPNLKSGTSSSMLLPSLYSIAQEVGVPLTDFVLEGISFLPVVRLQTPSNSIELLLSISCPKPGLELPSPKPFDRGKRQRRTSRREILDLFSKQAGIPETTLARMCHMTPKTLSKCLTILLRLHLGRGNLSLSSRTLLKEPRSARRVGSTEGSSCSRGTIHLNVSSS